VALMARKVNASFFGSPPRDVVTDAGLYERWLANAAGDAALVADLVTGANSTTPIDHTGAPLGCPIRLPLAAQHIDRSLVLSGAGSTVDEDDFYILGVPVFVRTGEAGVYRLTVDVTFPIGDPDANEVTAEVRSSSWALDYGPAPGLRAVIQNVNAGRRSYGDDALISTGEASGTTSTVTWAITLGEGLQYLMVRRYCAFADADPAARLLSWSLDHDRTYAGSSNGLEVQGSAVVGDLYEAPVLAPATVVDFYDEEIADEGPLSAWVLVQLNRKINALWEYITGAKIPGNNAQKNTSTWDNNRASFTAEALLELPMMISALGSINADTGKPSVDSYTSTSPTEGLIDWIMHPTAHSTANVNVETQLVRLPNFPTSSSALKCAVLIHTPFSSGDGANWRFRVTNSTTVTSSAAVAPVQIGSSNFHVATVTAIPFSAGADNQMTLQLAHTAVAALTEEIDLLGACYYYDP
jgi:hypothetical protein